MRTLARAALSLLAITAACDDRPMTVGRAPEPTATTPVTVIEAWSGWVEYSKFASGSDRVELSFTSASAGTMQLGEAKAPSPIDPNAPYPAHCSFDGPTAGLLAQTDPTTAVLEFCNEGLPLEMRDVMREGDRIRFTVDPLAPWTEWCAAQTSIHPAMDDASEYRCGPASFSTMTCRYRRGPEIEYSAPMTRSGCAYAAVCEGACTCTATGCTRREADVHQTVELEIRGDEANGTWGGTRIHLSRK